jgi:hypothetical protein
MIKKVRREKQFQYWTEYSTIWYLFGFLPVWKLTVINHQPVY